MRSVQPWPIEPPPSAWEFGDPEIGGHDHDFLGEGADLEPGTILAAYRRGIFPMPIQRNRPPAWWSPARRGVLPLDGLRVTRSLRKSGKRFEIRIDTAFEQVIEACADRRRPGGWITDEILAAYIRLHELGWTHSIEAWSVDDRLVGGLYGVAVDGLFAGESMFHRERDASKVALVALVDILTADREPEGEHRRLLDLQWLTPHLASLGAIEISRTDYLHLLDRALGASQPPAFAHPDERPA